MKKILKFLRKNNISPQVALVGLVILGAGVIFTAVQVANQISSGRSRAAGCAFSATIAASTCQEGCSETLDCASGLACIGGRCANPANPSSITCSGIAPTATPSPRPSVQPTLRPSGSPSPIGSPATAHPYEIVFTFLKASSGTSVIKNILADGKPLVLINGSTLSSVTITGTQSPVYTVRYANINQVPNAMTFRVDSGSVKIAGIIRDVTTGAILAQQPGTQTLTVGNWSANKNGTITKLP